MDKIRLFIADDHPIVRDGIRNYFSDFPDYEVVGEAENGQRTLDALPSLKPDIVIMDIAMHDPDGIQVTKRISKDFPHTKVVIFSMHDNRNFAVDAFRVGAAAYVIKGSEADELLFATKKVMAGKRYVSPPLVDELFSEFLDILTDNRRGVPYSSLSKREIGVLKLVVEGNTSKEIAQKLLISVSTVKTHRMNMMKKLNVTNAVGLVKVAALKGIG